MATSKTSGSTKIAKLRPAFSPEEVKRLIALLKGLKAKPVIIIKGIPKPDWLKGSFAAPNSDVAIQGLAELLRLGATFKPIKLFPKGIPIIDVIKVEFDLRAR